MRGVFKSPAENLTPCPPSYVQVGGGATRILINNVVITCDIKSVDIHKTYVIVNEN